MQLKFKRQEFQEKAVKSICDLFDGQTSAPSTFSVQKIDLVEMSQNELLGYGNRLQIEMKQIAKNLASIQIDNNLQVTNLDSLRFNVEMETGTGKTFVYIKTIYELNRRYGFSKFVVLVPSRAIREGTNKSFEIMKGHFEQEYHKRLDSFVYDSKKRNQVRNFALSPHLSVMIVTIDAINKDTNLFNRETDRLDKTPQQFIAQTRPILIIDEPQSVDNTEKARKAIEMLSPLFELRYSATHKTRINTVYRLSPVDAYQDGIVKQIVVANDIADEDFNKPYIKLIEVGNDGRFYAKLELDQKSGDSVLRKTTKVRTGENLQNKTGRDVYEGYTISGIILDEGNEHIEFSNTQTLHVGKAFGDIDQSQLTRSMIRRTIDAHLEKEMCLLNKGIKVLSLFFVDEVAKYRDYTADDLKGIYAKMFEEEYDSLIKQPKYKTLHDRFKGVPIDKIHNGYFSQDKTGKAKDTRGDTEDDDKTYNLIMRDKEKLLSFSSPLRFIWSHSALKEGWDNPNVFQICTLIENRTQFTARQKIGRGLRLCVNQDGERIDDRNINTLTVVAKESFADFAANLQREIEEETGIKFGIVDAELFINHSFTDEAGSIVTITTESATALVDHFKSVGYIDSRGTIKDTLKNDLKNGTLNLPARFENAKDRLVKLLQNVNTTIKPRQTRERVTVKRKDDLFMDDRFLALWDRIKQKSYYRINTHADKLIDAIIADIKKMDTIPPLSIRQTAAKIDMTDKAVTARQTIDRAGGELMIDSLPDIVRVLSEGSGLPRSNIGTILQDCGRVRDFINNPQRFIEVVLQIVNTHLRRMSIEGITYTKIDGQEYSLYEVFDLADSDEIHAYLSNTVEIKQTASLYSHIIYDSETVEQPFAQALEDDPNVEFFFKIPRKFKISTPVGNYTPDWAVFYKQDGVSRMYFVIETKGTTNRQDLSNLDNIKIACGEAHFAGINTDIKWKLAKVWTGYKK